MNIRVLFRYDLARFPHRFVSFLIVYFDIVLHAN